VLGPFTEQVQFCAQVLRARSRWNRGAEHTFGYTTDEAVNRSAVFLYPIDRQSESATLLEKVDRSNSIDNFETIRVKEDGTHTHVALTLSPITGADGR
jgi:PAS domain S-box-containing protein